MIPEAAKLFIELIARFRQGEVLKGEELSLLEKGMTDEACLKALDDQMTKELTATNGDDGIQENSDKLSDEFKRAAFTRFFQKLMAAELQLNDKKLTDGINEKHDSPLVDKDIQVQFSNPPLTLRTPKNFWRRNALAAAILILLMMIGGIVALQFKKKHQNTNLAADKGKYQRITPIVPGSSGAILILSNGNKVALGNIHKGPLHLGSLTIQQNKDAAKFTSRSAVLGQVQYNTLTTPRGRQFQVELPDGTKVWLNASSTLKFPTVFNRQNRTVELNGEAYFEVVHNSEHPFQVKVKGQLIQDIGTKFNVKAYNDESVVKTALVEGIVDISNGVKKLRLLPGQAVKAREGQMSVYPADFNQILAWKSGFFAFRNANVEEIMRQVSRWYDVDIAYGNQNGESINSQRFTGRIDRNLDLQDLLDGLQFARMHFKIDKNKRTIIIEN